MALTNIVGTLLLPDGTPYNGNLLISWGGIPWQADDGTLIPAGPGITVPVKNGEVDIDLQPTDGTTVPTPIYYYVLYRGTGPQSTPQVWSVPTSGSPVPLSSVIIPATSGSPIASGIVTLNGLATPTQLLARTNDTNVTLTITSAVSTHTFAMGWTGQVSPARGGTGDDTSAVTGVPKIAAGNWAYDAAAQDLNGWPAGVSNTEVSYLDGVTSAIQTQLNAKAPLSTAVNDLTWGTGANATITWGFNVSTGVDPALVLGNNFIGWNARTTTQQGDTTATHLVVAGAGNNAAETGIQSGGGGGSGDHAAVTFSSTTTPKWTLAGVWNGIADFVLRDPDDGYAAKLLVDKSSGNVVVGGETDGNFKVDIQKSGSSGTLRVYDQTPTTGESSLLIRLGPSQLGSGVGPFSIHRNAGTELAGVDNAGGFYTSNGTTREFVMGIGAASLAANIPINWSNTANDVDQTRDTGLARNAAGIVEANNGTPGSLRDVLARLHIGSATAAVDSQLANSQFTFVLTSNTNLQIRAKGSDGTVRTADITLS